MGAVNEPHESNKVPEKQGIQKVGYKRPPAHTRFKKGVSGNPGGVKKGTVFISEAYKRMLAMSPEELKNYKPKSVAEQIAIMQVRNAGGDGVKQQSLPAAKEIADRTEGKAPQTIKHTDVSDLERLVIRVQERAMAVLGVEITRQAVIEHIIAYRPELAGRFGAELMS